MSNINQLVFDSYLEETLIDRLFDILERPIDHHQIKDPLEFGDIISTPINKIANVAIHFDEKCEEVRGKIHDKDNETGKYNILITSPANPSNRDVRQIYDTLLHELSHIITDSKIPQFIHIKTKGFISTIDNLKDESIDIYNFSKEDCEKYLDYIFHIREMSNYAFSVAYAFRHDYKPGATIAKIFKSNNSLIIGYFDGTIPNSVFDKLVLALKDSDVLTLLKAQLAVKVLKKSFYNNKLASFKNLIIKYEKRLNKLLGTRT